MSEADRTDKESVELANEILRDFGISFSEAETNFKTSENFRKEFIDMTNKTSDKNVGSIEEDVKVLKDLMKELKLEKQTALHNNEYGEYITECDVLDLYDMQILALQHILAEREQKDKRIKELEEALLKVKDKNTTLFITCRNSIPMQVVIDKIKDNNQILDETNDGNLRERLYIENGILKELLERKK